MNRRNFIKQAAAGITVAGVAFTHQKSASDTIPGGHPFEARQTVYHCELLVVGGSSAGTAAALTAGRAGLQTILVLRSPRELGGLEANGLNPDSDLVMRCIGGFAMEMDILGRVSTGLKIEETKYVAPPHILFEYFRREFEKFPNITIIADYYPTATQKDGARLTTVTFRHRKNLNQTITIHPQITIDAEIEGDLTHLTGATTTLRREGRAPSADPTRNNEYSAGEIYVPKKDKGGSPLPQSTYKADETARTMGWSGLVVIEKYSVAAPDNPWLLTLPPAGYRAEDFDWVKGIGGVNLGHNHFRYSTDIWWSLIEGWKMPNGQHVLESMNIADREASERKHIARVLGALYHAQHVLGRTEWGLSSQSFREGLPPKYTLADFGTTTRAGDVPLPSLIYMREGRRLVNDQVFGGKFMEDQGTPARYQKTFWHPRSFFFNAMNIDIHGVTDRYVPESCPEGMQVPRFVHPNFGVCCIPFNTCLPRPAEVTQLLVASAGAYTHQAYSAFPRMEPGRFQIGAGCARAAFVALNDKKPVHEIDVAKIQLAGLYPSGQALVYFDDALPGTLQHVIDQMLGARGVPLQNAQGQWLAETRFTNKQARECLENFFVNYSENPIEKSLCQTATESLRNEAANRATWGAVLPVICRLSRFSVSPNFPELMQQLETTGFLTPGGSLHAETPLYFSDFKKLLFNLVFATQSPTGAIPLESGEILVRDTFNRPAEELTAPEIGTGYTGEIPWEVRDALAVPSSGDRDSWFWHPCEAPHFAARLDIFLEQTQTEATAGLAFREEGNRRYSRFRLVTEKYNVLARFESITGPTATILAQHTLNTMQRGFTLRVVKQENAWRCQVGHLPVFTVLIAQNVTQVGLFNGSGAVNLFDNFEVAQRWDEK